MEVDISTRSTVNISTPERLIDNFFRSISLVHVEFVTEDASVGEFLDPTTWAMESVRLPYAHTPGRRGLLVRYSDEWLSLPFMAVDAPESPEEEKA